MPALATKHSPAKINCFNCNCFFLYNLSLGHTSLAAYFDPVLQYKFSLVYFPFHANIYMFVKHRIGSRDYPDIIYPPRAQNFSRLNPDAKKMPGDSCSWQPTDELRHNFYQTTHYMIRLRNREVFFCCWGMSGLRATNCWNIWKLFKKKNYYRNYQFYK